MSAIFKKSPLKQQLNASKKRSESAKTSSQSTLIPPILMTLGSGGKVNPQLLAPYSSRPSSHNPPTRPLQNLTSKYKQQQLHEERRTKRKGLGVVPGGSKVKPPFHKGSGPTPLLAIPPPAPSAPAQSRKRASKNSSINAFSTSDQNTPDSHFLHPSMPFGNNIKNNQFRGSEIVNLTKKRKQIEESVVGPKGNKQHSTNFKKITRHSSSSRKSNLSFFDKNRHSVGHKKTSQGKDVIRAQIEHPNPENSVALMEKFMKTHEINELDSLLSDFF